jgi:hypothetical protein
MEERNIKRIRKGIGKGAIDGWNGRRRESGEGRYTAPRKERIRRRTGKKISTSS